MSAFYQTPLEWELGTYARALLEPPPALLVYEWAEKNIYLSERTSALPGDFSTLLTPYIREPLQAYADKRVTDMALCFGTQTAKTTVVMVGTAYRIVNDPAPTLWVLPNLDLAKSFSKTRWQPMVNDCAPLRDQKPDDRHLFGTTEQHFAKVTLNFVGSNSPSNLASRPAGLLNLDETDKFKMETDKEAGALQLAEERTKTFDFPLRVKTSTPTTVHGDIWKEFLAGDQRYYHVPCPHCSGVIEGHTGMGLTTWEDLDEDKRAIIRDSWITFRWHVKTEAHGDCGVRWFRVSEEESKSAGEGGALVWDMDKVAANAFYKCQKCGGEIYDHHKPQMLRLGIWVPTNPNAGAGRKSYHLNSLYSLLGRECRLGSLAVKWLQTVGNVTKRHNFINSTLAEPWDEEMAVDDAPVRFSEYEAQDILAASIAERTVILSGDLQHNHSWCIVRAWAPPTPAKPSGESWLLFAGRVEGGFEEIEELQRKYAVESGNVILDIAHFTNTACAALVKHGWRGAWGSDKKGFIHTEDSGDRVIKAWSPVQKRDPMLGTNLQSEHNARAFFVYWANDPIKDMLEALRCAEPAVFHVPGSVCEEYGKHMNSEMKVLKQSAMTGRAQYVWRRMRKANHLRDAEAMNLLRAMRLGLVPVPEDPRNARQVPLPGMALT